MQSKAEPECRICGRTAAKHTPEERAKPDAWDVWKPWKKALAPKHPFLAPFVIVQQTQMGADESPRVRQMN